MRYKILGSTGLRVSEVALGSGTFGTAWGWGADRSESLGLLELFAQAGGNFIDSAGGYQNGLAEQFVGEFIRSERANFVVTTKYSGPASTESAGNLIAATGNSRKALLHALEATLRRLGSEYVDVLYVHFADQLTPTEEILRGFEDAVRAGKALFVGFSDFPAWRIARADGRCLGAHSHTLGDPRWRIAHGQVPARHARGPAHSGGRADLDRVHAAPYAHPGCARGRLARDRSLHRASGDCMGARLYRAPL